MHSLSICYLLLTAKALSYKETWDMVPMVNLIFHSFYNMIHCHSSQSGGIMSSSYKFEWEFSLFYLPGMMEVLLYDL